MAELKATGGNWRQQLKHAEDRPAVELAIAHAPERLRPLDPGAGSPVDGQRRQRQRVVRCSLRHHRSPRGSRAFAAVDRNA
ncbi:hypothetical protein G6F60_015498 [Rhizopus arrhizus]|nr:hypothetical protein G6F60_015498 [Rhizopus arrhizus]